MSDPAIGRAQSLLERLSADPVSRQLAEMREKAVVCYQLDLAAARQEGRAEGEAKGEARGEARGRAEGEARGRAEGEAEGEARGRAEAVIAVLAARRVDVPESLCTQILSCRDTAALDRCLARAATCEAADELGDAVGGECGAVGKGS